MTNVFHPIETLNNAIVQPWIFKSRVELNRFTQYIICLNSFEKEIPNYHSCHALHESLNSCSVSIVFSLFNIFALVTKTKACFFDQSIRDYFLERVKLTSKESYLLSFFWHEPVLSMNSLGYSAEEHLKIYTSEVGIGFSVLTRKANADSDQIENTEVTSSMKFYTFHLVQLLSTIELVASLLNPCKPSQSQANSLLQIENYNDLYSIIESILRKIKCTT